MFHLCAKNVPLSLSKIFQDVVLKRYLGRMDINAHGRMDRHTMPPPTLHWATDVYTINNKSRKHIDSKSESLTAIIISVNMASHNLVLLFLFKLLPE